MILKTYTRIFSTDLDGTLALLQKLYTGEPHLRVTFGAWQCLTVNQETCPRIHHNRHFCSST